MRLVKIFMDWLLWNCYNLSPSDIEKFKQHVNRPDTTKPLIARMNDLERRFEETKNDPGPQVSEEPDLAPIKQTRAAWPRIKRLLEEADAREMYWRNRGGIPVKEANT